MKNFVLFLLSVIGGAILMVLILKSIPRDNTTQLQSPQNSLPPQSKFSIANAPSDTLKGQIISFSGKVGWQSREATEPAALASPIPLQQGERLTTGGNGHVDLKIGAKIEVKMLPQSDLNIVQTLPANVVFGQSSGTAELISTDKVPISVRALHLLVTLISGDMSVTVASESGTVSVVVNKGQVTTAYNDSSNVSTVNTVAPGNSFNFDDNTLESSVDHL